VVVLLGGTLSACFPQPSCGLVPQLRDVTVNQGVGTYPRLARGKETLVRFFLSTPRCADADDSVRITGGAMTVSQGTTTLGTVTTPTPGLVPTFPPLTPFATSPSPDSSGDPIFVVPGNVLAPSSTTAAFTATFRATLRYESRTSPNATPTTGSVTFSQTPQGTSISREVERRTNALRILVVPMGDPTRLFASQFSEAARGAVQQGLATVSRVFPVPAGVTELSGNGGLRYTILPSLLDLRPWLVNGVFCGTGENYNGFKGLLAQFLRTWNSAPTNPPADRVLGVVDAAISLGGERGCAEGMASVGATEAWARAKPGGTPSDTGALMAMELGHSLGLVPPERDSLFNPFHSSHQQADDTAPDRGYNSQLRAFLPDDRNAMLLSGTWNERNVLLEPDDWAFLLCALGGSTGGCPAPGSVGSAVNVGAEPTFVISGTTTGTAAGTSVTESYFRLGVPRTEPAPGSEYRLVQLAGASAVRDDGVLVETVGSEHDDQPSSVDEVAIGLFSAAVPFDTRATRIELRRGSAVLYARDRDGPPVFAGSGVGVTVPGGGGNPGVEVVSPDSAGGAANAPSFSPDVSADGRFVAFASNASDLVAGDTNGAADVFVRDRQTGSTTRVSVSSAEAQVDGPTGSLAPAISADGRFVAFVSDATDVVPGDTNGAFDVFVRDRTAGTTERGSITSSEAQVAGAVDLAVDISGNGNAVAFTSTAAYESGDTNGQRDVYVRDRAAGTTTRASLTDAGAQSTLASVAGPSLNGDGTIVAFTSPDLTADDPGAALDVYVRNRTASTTTLVTTGSNGVSTQPSISADGRFVAFLTTATSLAAGDGNGVADVLLKDRSTGTVERISVDTADAQLPLASYATSISSDGARVAFLNGASPGNPQVLVRDRPGGRTIPAGTATDGVEPSLSGNGRFVAFGSAASQFTGDPGGERDVYLRDLDAVPPPTAPGLRDVAVGVTDSRPADVRLDVYYVCGSIQYPVGVALTPAAVSGTVATFAATFDTTSACTGGELVAVANDGFETSTSEPTGVPDDGDDRNPSVAIVTPYAGTTLLQYSAITLRGTAKDPEGSDRIALRWSLDGASVGTGPVVDLTPPAGGWPLGQHTITLQGTDPAGQPVVVTRTITILADADNNGVPD
jgi:Tol biopolymer transport system component